jgi:LmeA-like phospholipid-binding
MQDAPNLEEQAVSKAIEATITSQVDAIEEIDVDIQTNLLKLILGQADSIELAGKGLVMQKDIRLQEIEVNANNIDIDTFSAFFGQIELDKPIDATAKIVITEPDLNRALNSEYVLKKARNFKLNVDGKTVILEMQQMKLQFPEDNKMLFTGKIILHEKGETQPIGFTAAFRPRTQKQPVIVESFQCDREQGIPFAISVALMQKIKQWIELPYLDLEGIALRVQEMTVRSGQLTLQLQMRMKHLPDNLTVKNAN